MSAIVQLQFAGLTIPRAAAINAAAGRVRQIAAAGARAPVRLTYGTDRLGADILNVLLAGAGSTTLLVQCLWGHAVHAVDQVLLNAQALPTGATVTHYTGGQTTPDAALVAAFAAQGITYTDALTGYAYSVVALPIRAFEGTLDITARVQGRRLYDPRKDGTQPGGSGSHRLADPSTWEWSDNPALADADFLASQVYGAGKVVDWSTVPLAAAACDAMIGSPAEKRRIVGVTFSQPATAGEIAEALRAYAGCWHVPGTSGIRLLPDVDAAPTATYAHAAGQIAAIEPLQVQDLGNAPTAVEVVYTDTSVTPWREDTALATLPGAGSTLPWRLSQVRLPGIHRYSQAYREAVERLNKLRLSGVSTVADVFDEGLAHDVGDIVAITHPLGLSAQPMRVQSSTMTRPGRWRLGLVVHDPAAYSTAVVTRPGGVLPSGVLGLGTTALILRASSTTVQALPGGGYSPAAITLTALRFGSLIGDITWSVPAGFVTLTGTGDTRSIDPATLLSPSATIRVSITEGGETYTDEVTVASLTAAAGSALLTLTADGIAMVFADANAATSGSPTITFTASLQNLSGPATFVATAYDAAGSSLGTITLGGTGNVRTLTAAQFVTYAGTRRVTVVASVGAVSDTATVIRADQGTSALQAVLTNESHTLPADAGGTVTNYALSGTVIGVAEGVTPLTYDGAGTAPGTWTVSASGTNITPGAISAQGSNAVTAVASAATADVASIDFTITGRTLTGASFSLSKTQRFAKSRAGAAGTNGTNGANGTNGVNGVNGASRFIAYIAAANSSATPATPGTTTNGATPAGWSATPVTLTGTQAQFQSDGTQPAGSTTTTWSTPYLSYFRVAQLSAIAADLGTVTAGTINTSGWVRAEGNTSVSVPGLGTYTAAIIGNFTGSATVGVAARGQDNGPGARGFGLYGTASTTQAGAVGVYGLAFTGVYGAGSSTSGSSGVYGIAGNNASAYGVFGEVGNVGIGVRGRAPDVNNAIGVSAEAAGTNAIALRVQGRMTMTNTTEVTNLNAQLHGGRTAAQMAWVNTTNLPNGATLDSVQSGAATITFNGTNSPGTFTGANTWLVVLINGTLYKLPIWQANT